MRTSEEIQKDVTSIQLKVTPLLAKLAKLEAELSHAKSVEFIKLKVIKRADVEMASGEGKPYFHLLDEFISWIIKQPRQKRFAEWNDRIYFTSDLIAGKMPDMPARITDLTE